ncbi:MAG: RluA family pseudouridine synthase [Clostridiales bacterium]|nr:RluA family pseudouridine synthase [Clostridiales bacterium]MDY4182271.1 RluA family pseudouridine synthase [Pseudoflavonifractor sp.]
MSPVSGRSPLPPGPSCEDAAGPRRLTLTVPPELSGAAVDVLLRRTLRLSGTTVKRAKRFPGGILLDGLPVFVTARAAAGQVLSVLVGDTEEDGGVIPAPGPLSIVYEDGDILILNKAPGVAVHPSPDHFDDTLGNFVSYYYKSTGQTARFRPVNRLDRGTSGLMCVAKHAHAQEVLKAQLHTPAFRRVYLAVCDGTPVPPSGAVEAPIGRAEGSVLRRQVAPDGAPARTRYRVLSVCNGRSLVRLELDTGRTHQIRVHMAHLGCPLTGDFLYGTEDKALIGRAALHSAALSLIHPVTGAAMEWSAPLPADMARLLDGDALRALEGEDTVC